MVDVWIRAAEAVPMRIPGEVAPHVFVDQRLEIEAGVP